MELIDFTKKLAKKAGKLIEKYQKKGFKVELKGKNDLVTTADKKSEELIIKAIKKEYPDHAILAEESFDDENGLDSIKDAPYIWIIDPIDGTTNFAHNIPLYAISIAIFKREESESSKNFDYLSGEIIAGVIYAPRTNELFHAEKGKGAFLNNKKIHVSKTKKLQDSLMVTGFPRTEKESNLPYFEAMLYETQAIRRLGAASLDMAYIAAGRFDGFWEFGLSAWDIAAGALLIEEAGGAVTDTNGELLDLFGGDLFVSNGEIHEESLEIFKELAP